MRPDPGRDTLERIHGSLAPEARARLGQDLRARGLLSVWDQVDRAEPMSPVEEGLFILERLYPEMPAGHRASLGRQMEAAYQAAGTSQRPQLARLPAAARLVPRRAHAPRHSLGVLDPPIRSDAGSGVRCADARES